MARPVRTTANPSRMRTTPTRITGDRRRVVGRAPAAAPSAAASSEPEPLAFDEAPSRCLMSIPLMTPRIALPRRADGDTPRPGPSGCRLAGDLHGRLNGTGRSLVPRPVDAAPLKGGAISGDDAVDHLLQREA